MKPLYRGFLCIIMKLSKESIEYCKTIRGKNYKGCGNDYEFCKICRSNPMITKESLKQWEEKINNYASKKNRY